MVLIVCGDDRCNWPENLLIKSGHSFFYSGKHRRGIPCTRLIRDGSSQHTFSTGPDTRFDLLVDLIPQIFPRHRPEIGAAIRGITHMVGLDLFNEEDRKSTRLNSSHVAI